MSDKKIDIVKTFNHWIASSDKDFDTMIHLYESKDYHWALFIGHIVIERLLKALIVKITLDHAPFSHDLRRLAKLTQKDFPVNNLEWLDSITSFNLNARYDSYQQAFYRKCNADFTSEWISNIKELRSWIKQML